MPDITTQDSIEKSLQAIKVAVGADGSTLSDIAIVAGKLSKVFSAVSAGYTILQVIGVIESSEQKIFKELEAIRNDLNNRFKKIEEKLSTIETKIEWQEWNGFLKDLESSSRNAFEAISSFQKGKNKDELVVTVDSVPRAVGDWGDDYWKEFSKLLANFYEYFLHGSASSISNQAPLLQKATEIFRSSQDGVQSTYYLTQNYNFCLLRLYIILFYGCRLALLKANKQPTNNSYDEFSKNIEEKLKDICTKRNDIFQSMKMKDRCYVSGKWEEQFLTFIRGEDSYSARGFGFDPLIIPNKEKYSNYVVVGMRLVQGWGSSSIGGQIPVAVPIAKLQLKIGKVGSCLSLSDVRWFDYDEMRNAEMGPWNNFIGSYFKMSLFGKDTTDNYGLAEKVGRASDLRYFTSEPSLPDEKLLGTNEISVVTGAQIVKNQNRFVLITYSSPLDLSDPEKPILRRDFPELKSQPEFNESNYFGTYEPASAGGNSVEYVDMQEVVPSFLSPIRGASFCYRRNRISLQLRTDLPLYSLASLQPQLQAPESLLKSLIA